MTNQELHDQAKHNMTHLFESAVTETGPMIPLAEATKMGLFSLDVYRTMIAETLKHQLSTMSEEDQMRYGRGISYSVRLLAGE